MLTDRELEVLKLKADGLTSKEVGVRLAISRRTVDFHLANVYEKFMVANLIQAVKVAQSQNII